MATPRLSFVRLVAVTVLVWNTSKSQVSSNNILGYSLSPPYFNLASGSRITATATCGEDQLGRPRTDLYCKLVGGPISGLPSQTIQGQFCDHCNSNNPNKAHPISNAIDGTESWWQSPPLSRGLEYNEINVTLDLGQLFHVAYVLIKFANSPRPDLWVLERSVDHGRTFLPWQYFAHSKRECIERFGKQPNQHNIRDDEQICTTEYSRIVPLENGEVVVSLVNGRPGSRNFTHSPVLRDFTKATNIRLRFLRTSTLLGHLISKAQRDPTVTRRYYYSIKDISVGGRCVCHGHAQECEGRIPGRQDRLQCDCKHNTCGESCDRCCPGFNQKPWRPATADSANECQPCQCHSHATDCYYDPEVERRRASLDIYGRYDGGGVCLNCQHNTAGVNCEVCAEGYYRPYGVPLDSSTGCIPCRCDPRTAQGCEMGSGRCTCRPEYGGDNCNQCAAGFYGYPQCIRYPIFPATTKSLSGNIKEPTVCPTGYFGAPSCRPCLCEPQGTVPEVCSAVGTCLCRPGIVGERCDRCHEGYHSFPYCQECRCDGHGVADNSCGPRGECRCQAMFTGSQCEQCATGYYGYPYCSLCQCHPEGARGEMCHSVSGQCACQPGVAGLRCDRCASPGLQFPYCTGPTPAPTSQCNPEGSQHNIKDSQGSCVCLPNVEGLLCEQCKPLYWNLARDNPGGCVECTCDDKGTLSGVQECYQETGQCHCKPNTCGHSCNRCKESHYLITRRNYFGCQGCQCDVGGALASGCHAQSGQCQCRKNIRGRTCNEPEPNFYFPSLHHLKFEVEDGVSPNARPVRFGYNPREFPQFSWKGYAIMSPAQSEVSVSVIVDDAQRSAYLLLLHYVNTGQTSVTGHVTASRSRGGTGESQELVFPPSRTPTLLTVPGNGFAQPFTLQPGRWNLHIRAEGILLDYVVLLPSDYYEAPILQQTITEPCTYTKAEPDKNCLLYRHVPMERFPSTLGSQGLLSVRGHRRRRQTRTRRPTADHPEMAHVSGRQAQLQVVLPPRRPGLYVVVLEYASEVEVVQNVNLQVSAPSQEATYARATIYTCTYSFLCRSVAVDRENRVAKLQVSQRAELLLHSSTASFLLHKIYLVPAEEFSMDYVEPKVLCISVHGKFTEDSQSCLRSQFRSPPSAVVLHPTYSLYQAPTHPASSGPHSPPAAGLRSNGLLLKSPQTEVTLSGRVPAPGRYVFVLHMHQSEHPAFPLEVLIDAGRTWTGWLNASFCPAVSGCRSVFITARRIALELPRAQVDITLRIPQGKTLTLDYILAVPDDRYAPDLLKEKPLDKTSDFIARCGGDSFQINYKTASEFCQASARSLVALYHNGALPCSCDMLGSTGPTCDPVGGQCPCRPHVIGRQCTRCSTGFYGFPYCRPCECGQRLCDEVTGECICPPQTVRPACDVCASHTFSYHPLVGCDHCDCSLTGVTGPTGDQCDVQTGQCMCKPRIGGRQCDRCAAGYFRFPECVLCDCNNGGVRPEVCDPNTGQCLCKRNVEGLRCESCRKGTFHFDSANPSGCTECFCFGATNKCRSSSKRRGKFVDMRNWRLERDDGHEVASVLNPSSNTVVADIQELPRSTQSLHWVAPASYLGDRVSSYGGYLTYQIKAFGIPSEGMAPLDKQPDVLLTGDRMTLAFFDPQLPEPDQLYQGRLQLVEGNLRHAGTRRFVTRGEVLRVLAALEEVQVRALHFTKSQRLSLGEVGLEEASHTGRGAAASTVEVCSCPPNYSGDSCQRCARGFYRDRSGQLPGRCVACSCNGLSDECEDGSGRCLNCQGNTGGLHCDQCQEGYYGNAVQGSCQLCPCPHNVATNNFAVGCKEVSGRFQCFCKPGYSGERCERCAPGYYGSPLTYGGSCRPCNCNGNLGGCDPKTGVCQNTLEPKDTNTDEQCGECDSCAQTLLSDLERLDDELVRIKSQLEKANASSSSQDRLKKLEEAITAAKVLVNTFTSTVNRKKSKVSGLEQDTQTLDDDINNLNKQADTKKRDAEKALEDVEDTHQRAKALNTQAQNLYKKIQDLLRQLQDADANGDSVAPDQLAKMLEEAERLVKEMESRNLKKQKDAAEEERDQAHKLLEYVKNNVTKQCDKNEEATERIAKLITDHEAKLKDLEEALKDAKDLVRRANAHNALNSKAMDNLLDQIKNLEIEKDKVADQIAMAKAQLKNTGDILATLENSKKEYERLAAQLDGAKTDLTKRVNEISQAAAKEAIVKKAEEHARQLNDLANQLQKSVNDSSGSNDVQNALSAIDAYKSIVDAIEAADRAAKEAKEAADKALQDVNAKDLVEKAKTLKEKGTELATAASDAKRDLDAAKSELEDQKTRLEDANKKKQELEKDLQKAKDKLQEIQRDDISSLIDEAKRAAASANNTATDAMERLDDIKKEVDKIKVTPGQTNLDSVLNDVDNSVKNLSNTIPSLLDKIGRIEDLSSQATPMSNVSENIKRIKELIERARDAANRVLVPMKFRGDSHVELRPPKSVDDLRAYTTLSLLLQRPPEGTAGRGDGKRRRRQARSNDLFVLYLGKKDASGDYIGMALRNEVLYTVYRLNGVEYEIRSDEITQSESNPAFFDKVDLHRIYQDAEVILTKSYTSNNPLDPQSDTKQGENTENLLDIDPGNVVFYVGGYPDSFTPPPSLNYPKYRGCIELSSFNERFISLYNFQKAVNVQETPCKRYARSESTVFFEGTGYARLELKSSSIQRGRLQQHITTKSQNGLLLYIGDENTFYMVSLEKGHLVLSGRANSQDLTPVRSETRVTPMEKDFLVVLGTSEIKVIYPGIKLSASYVPGDFKDYYIGGVPQELREKFNIRIQPLKGCVKNVKDTGQNAAYVEKVGVSKGCPTDFLALRKAEFTSGSSLESSFDGFSLAGDVMLSLGFRSTEANGLLLTKSTQGTGLELAMVGGHVVLKFADTSLKSKKQYQDGKWHYVTVRRQSTSVEMLIDESDTGDSDSGSKVISSSEMLILGKSTFKGCLSNLYTRRPAKLYRPEDLSAFSSNGDVLLDVCSAERPPEQLLATRNHSVSRQR